MKPDEVAGWAMAGTAVYKAIQAIVDRVRKRRAAKRAKAAKEPCK